MIWKEYEDNFRKAALSAGHDDTYIKKNLEKAYLLHSRDLPIIYDQTHFSYLVGYHLDYLLKVSNSPKKFYRYFQIPKKNGNYRSIAEPLPNLKFIQKWILEEILYKCETSQFAKAYRKKVSLKDNAKFHRGQKKVLTIDIVDFFGAIKPWKVYNFFVSLGYSKDVAFLLTKVCTLKEKLPQGASTSPALSNLLMKMSDEKIGAFCKEKQIRYTRYADDLTFSGDFDVGELIIFIKEILNSQGFEINNDKTRVRGQHQRQEVTGIIVNKKLQVASETRKQLRQQVYYIKKYGLDSHLTLIKKEKYSYLKHLLGLANHISFVNPKDTKAREYLIFLKELWKYEKNKF